MLSEAFVRPSRTCMNFAWQVSASLAYCCCCSRCHLRPICSVGLLHHFRASASSCRRSEVSGFLAMGSCCVTQQPADSSDDHAAPHVGKMIMTHQAMIKHEDEEVNSIIPVKPMVCFVLLLAWYSFAWLRFSGCKSKVHVGPWPLQSTYFFSVRVSALSN